MTNLTLISPQRHKLFEALESAFLDFLLSREAMLCSPATLKFYRFTGNKIIDWMKHAGIQAPEDINRQHIRGYLSEMARRGLSDSYIHSHARVIKTFIRFLHSEGYIPVTVEFQMPAISQKRLPVLRPDEIRRVLGACTCIRDKALVMLLVDSGARRSETCSLNWGNIDLNNGLVNIKRGKGGKARSVVVGISTRRDLLKYRRTVRHEYDDPLFQTSRQRRLTPNGLRSVLVRLSERSGVKVAPHILRRTFATLSLKAGMNPLHLQGLLGHASLEMTKRYILMVDEDLLEAHKEYGPIDRYLL